MTRTMTPEWRLRLSEAQQRRLQDPNYRARLADQARVASARHAEEAAKRHTGIAPKSCHDPECALPEHKGDRIRRMEERREAKRVYIRRTEEERAARKAALEEKKRVEAEIRAAKAEMDASREKWRDLKKRTGRIRTHRNHHGLDEEAWRTALERVGWKCEGCGTAIDLESGTVDHDHDHGCAHKPSNGCPECFRSVLCNTCNAAMGMLKDDPVLIRKIADISERLR